MPTVLLPVTRAWTLEPFCRALAASDIPRGLLLLVVDAPGCEGWAPALRGLGFTVQETVTNNPHPPHDMLARRPRHAAMRRLTQSLVPDGLLLCLEDDSLVPPDVWAQLSAVGPTCTGVQRSRYSRELGVIGHHGRRYVVPSRGVEAIESCGLYCLLTTGEAYRRPFEVIGAVDVAQTSPMEPRVVWGCSIGHITETEVLMPDEKYPMTQDGHADLNDPNREDRPGDAKGDGVRITANPPGRVGPFFRTLGRVVIDGSLKAAPRQRVLLAKAVEWGIANPDGTAREDAVYYDMPIPKGGLDAERVLPSTEAPVVEAEPQAEAPAAGQPEPTVGDSGNPADIIAAEVTPDVDAAITEAGAVVPETPAPFFDQMAELAAVADAANAPVETPVFPGTFTDVQPHADGQGFDYTPTPAAVDEAAAPAESDPASED